MSLRGLVAATCVLLASPGSVSATRAPVPVTPIFDGPLPTSVVVGVQAYPPFVLQRAWPGKSLKELYTVPSNGTLASTGLSLIDGFDVAMAQLVLTSILGITNVSFQVYPDTSSLYVGLRNGEVDVITSAVEYEPTRASCNRGTCPVLNASSLIPEYPTSDYGQPSYNSRLQQVCCLSYGVSYFQSGFSLLSISQPAPNSVTDAIVNVDVLNAGTPVVVAIFSFGFVMTVIEYGRNKEHFDGIWSSAYFATVATSTFGFGDKVPITALGRGITVFWTVFSVLSITAFSGVVGSKLTIGGLQYTQINDFSNLQPSDVCVETAYPVANSYVASIFGLPLDANGHVTGGVMVASVPDCFAALSNGKVKVFVDDFPLLNWLAFVYSQAPNWYVSPPLRANPLVWAYPRGSPLQSPVDQAIMRTIVGNTWYGAAQSVVTQWLPASATVVGPPVSTINWTWLAAAIAFVAFWLVFGSLQNFMRLEWTQNMVRKMRGQPIESPPDPLQRLDAARKAAFAAHAALDTALYDLAAAAEGCKYAAPAPAPASSPSVIPSTEL